MDFSLSEEQQALGDLAAQVFGGGATHERLRALEQEHDTVFDGDLWAAAAQAGLLGAVVPEEHGGAGLGFLELLPVLEQQGRHVAPIPLVETLVLGALGLARFGTPEQQAAFLPGVASGDVILTMALHEGPAGDPTAPTAELSTDGDGYRLDGELPFVAYGRQATRVIAAVAAEGGTQVVLLDPSAEGVEIVDLVPTNRQPQAGLLLSGVRLGAGDVLAGADRADEVLQWLAEHGAAAWCLVQAGVCEGAVRLTATYTSQRQQFGKPIAEFQAVAQRAADAFIDTQMLRLTALHAAYRLSQGLDATAEVHAAKFWAGDGAMRAVHGAQHLHGGMGVDLDYPVHRYFLWAKRIEHTLGTPTRELVRLGAILADEPAAR